MMPNDYLMLMPFDGLLNEARRLKAEKADIVGALKPITQQLNKAYLFNGYTGGPLAEQETRRVMDRAYLIINKAEQ